MIRHVGADIAISDAVVTRGVSRESWDYPNVDTQHLTHGIHRYSGKFIPQIASRAIKILTKPGELVFDPYCGSGTTLLEAALLGRGAMGLDLNPLAVLIASAKTTRIRIDLLKSLEASIHVELSFLDLERRRPPLHEGLDGTDLRFAAVRDRRLTDGWFTKWYEAGVLEELVIIDHVVTRIENPQLRNVARVAFSDIVRRCSRAHSGYPNVMFDRNAPARSLPGPLFLRTLRSVCRTVASLWSSSADLERVAVKQGTASKISVADDSVDAIITHPPYVGSIPYAEYQALSLKWIGADSKTLDRALTGGRRHTSDVVRRFRESYGEMWAECARVLRPGRCAFVMVGNPVVRGGTVDLALMSTELAYLAGLQLVTAAQRQGINRRANKMGVEHLLFFRKPGDRLRAKRRAEVADLCPTSCQS